MATNIHFNVNQGIISYSAPCIVGLPEVQTTYNRGKGTVLRGNDV